MTQVNTYYPATSFLKGYLSSRQIQVDQDDLSLRLFLQIFSSEGLKKIAKAILNSNTETSKKKKKSKPGFKDFFLENLTDYTTTIDPVIRFLQGKDPSLALRLSQRTLVPEGPRFEPLNQHAELLESFGHMGTQDKAKYIASLYIDDISDLIKSHVDPFFELSRYAEQLAESEPSFQPLLDRLNRSPTVIDLMLEQSITQRMKGKSYQIVGLTVPFPGNMYGALRIAKQIRKISPKTRIVMGGGFISTELRKISDPRFFEFVDDLVFDDGEIALEQIIKNEANKVSREQAIPGVLNKFNYQRGIQKGASIRFSESATPDLTGLPLNEYVSMLEMPNPMYRLWSDFRWNKIMLAHGCYWKRCTFCDTNLDYIGRYDPQKVENIIEQMISLSKQSGSTGFHFVDEAAPPALLKALSLELIRRNLKYTWWGNLRFDKQFTPEICELMADAGCVAVTGGLEVASPRVLKLIDKGITVDQVRKVTSAFVDAGIYVHAYLMYGFPSETKKETLESLETVRQLFQDGCLHSAHWHRFVCTAHSPVGKNPDQFGIQLKPRKAPKEGLFAEYEIPFIDKVKTDNDELGKHLRKELYNYMHGIF